MINGHVADVIFQQDQFKVILDKGLFFYFQSAPKIGQLVDSDGRGGMPGMNEPITVLKLNLTGEVTWQYQGRILAREGNLVVLEAFFNRPDTPFMDVELKENDRFVETFYTDRWYNIFEIYDRDDDRLKGWYCNVGRPAVLTAGAVSYVDLALDLWISPEGKQTVLDEDEFSLLDLDARERQKALAALAELQQVFKIKRPPD